jgi:hypothetical protein
MCLCLCVCVCSRVPQEIAGTRNARRPPPQTPAPNPSPKPTPPPNPAPNHTPPSQLIAKPGTVKTHRTFEAEVYALTKEEGGRHTPFTNNYRPQFFFRTADITGGGLFCIGGFYRARVWSAPGLIET